MKVYIAQRNYDYEGFTVIGVYSTREAAQAACDNDRWPEGDMRGDSQEVSEYTLDALAE